MADELGSISDLVQVVERKMDQKLEQLAASVRSGFTGVDEAFADQRLYTELAVARIGTDIHRLESKLDTRFSSLERRMEQILELHQDLHLDLHLPKRPPGAAESG